MFILDILAPVICQATMDFQGHIPHMSVQSQLQTKNVQDIWHMPNYSLISWVPKTGKNKKIQRGSKKLGPIKVFSI